MPLPSDPAPWCFYRLGPTKEKELFKRRRDTYDGVIVPAHIASFYAAFCAEFIGSLQKPYLIDPMTYLFAGDPALLKRFVKDRTSGRTLRDASGQKKKGDLKRSFSKLVEKDYGGLIQGAVNADRALVVRDFRASAAVDEMVRQVFEFQAGKLSKLPEKYRKYQKYAQKHGHPASTGAHPPMCIVPPYFSLELRPSLEWLNINVDLIARTKVQTTLPAFATILATPSTLQQNATQIVAEYASVKPDGYLLWVDGFASDQDVAALRAVYDFVGRLSGEGKPVILLYGDAFALVLHFAGLRGFGCGICYAEQKLSTKDVDVEGVIPPRYYVRPLKKKVRIETELRRIDLSKYQGLRCDCDICRRKRDPGTLDDAESREHFMLARKQEVDALRGGLTQSAFASELDRAYTQYRVDPLLDPLVHLRNWAGVLTEK